MSRSLVTSWALRFRKVFGNEPENIFGGGPLSLFVPAPFVGLVLSILPFLRESEFGTVLLIWSTIGFVTITITCVVLGVSSSVLLAAVTELI